MSDGVVPACSEGNKLLEAGARSAPTTAEPSLCEVAHGPEAHGRGVVAEPQARILRNTSRLTLAHSHAHAQWRTIAEEFSTLLDQDFVDVVFRVRGNSGLLGAHRTLIAAAWPVLREELRGMEVPPADVRSMSLSWVACVADSPGEPATTPPLATPIPPASPGRSAAPSVAADGPGEGDAVQGNLRAGVFDISSRPWGSYNIMRALLCHLYSLPVVVHERELAMLRVAALHVGSTELARCCDDVDRRPMPRAPVGLAVGPSRPGTPELPDMVVSSYTEKGGIPAVPSDSSALSQEAHIHKTLSPSEPVRLPKTLSPSEPGRLQWASSREAPPGEEATSSESSSTRVPSRTYFGESGEAHALPMAKPRGEWSFNAKAFNTDRPSEGDKRPAETGGVRRVLSEIKRNIMESARIIGDRTFQSMYEMVPGERGILGEGINGPVRMAKHRKTGREVAVKRISCMNLSEQRRQMLVSEVRIFLQVSHRNIVQLLEVYESEVDQAVLLVMELCTGKELFERLAERRWYSEFDAARVARQMLDAVSYLHSQNICHRDLKLENWLYENPSQEAKLKLCDFGFGQIVEPSVQLTATLGSLFYVAPEVLEGSYGLPCDMWSVGVIVYMLLGGIPPFDGKTDVDVMTKIKQGRFVTTGRRWEGISEKAKNFVRSMLRKDPYERLTAAEAAQHAWLKMEFSAPKGMTYHGYPDAELELPIDRGVITDMSNFAQNNAITRAALGMLAKLNTSSFGGREEDVSALEKSFRNFDENDTGNCRVETFIQVLKQNLHLQITVAEEKQFFERIAGSLSGREEGGGEQQKGRQRRREVNYREFITLLKARRMANNTAAIREAFRAYDVCGDGYVKEGDIQNLFGDEFKTTIENCAEVKGNEYIDYARLANIVSQEIAEKEDEGVEHRDSNSSALAPASSPEAVSRDGGGSAAGAGELSRITSDDPQNYKQHPNDQDQEACDDRDTGGSQRNAADADDRQEASAVEGGQEKGAAKAGGDESCREARAKRAETQCDDEWEEPNEEEDNDAQSDEEQLKNVKAEEGGDSRTQEDPTGQEGKKPAGKDGKDAGRYQCFSLSLAGSSEYDDVNWGVNRVLSMPSDVYTVRQLPGFHTRTLRPFYATRPVSNVVMGLIRGTSLYAKQSVLAKLATIIHTTCGWFFIMPNPKKHNEVDSKKGLLSKESGKFRFVAWWIHPRFVPQLRQWFERLTYEGLDQERQERRREARAQQEAHAKERFRNTAGTSNSGASPSDAATEGGGGSVPDTGAAAGTGGTPNNNVAVGAPETAPPARKPEPPGVPSESVKIPPDTPKLPKAPFMPEGIEANPAPPPEGPPVLSRIESCPPVLSRSEIGSVPRGRGAYNEKDATEKDCNIGAPGDFGFSDLPKPENYLHTYRDLHTKDHQNMLSQLYEGSHRFLRSLFDENFMAHAQISAGFHYPVRTQYATLHMQLRINSGTVARDDGRGVEIQTLIETLKRDRHAYERDSETLRYHVTENVKVSLLAAANEYEEQNPGESASRQAAPFSFELGVTAMPTIQDEGEEDEETAEAAENGAGAGHDGDSSASQPRGQDDNKAEADAGSEGRCADSGVTTGQGQSMPFHPPAREPAPAEDEAVASYLVNLQPSCGSAFHKVIYEHRAKCAEAYGCDPTYLYPFHISVTGFFEASARQVDRLLTLMQEMLQSDIDMTDNVTVGKVICTKTGYVLFDMKAKAITNSIQRLGERSSRELDLHIRPKAVNHISLASNRPDEATREKIREIYEPADDEARAAEREVYASASFDLVLSRLVQRSSFERLAEDGPHQFLEVARLPVRCGAAIGATVPQSDDGGCSSEGGISRC